ncbi:baseplate J/gp47 family protein [Escherichia coli]|uniref:baseplate J/gp47 family protein n=2 Tax=Escherichia coli TaxID=562 RepID=UPI0006A3F457|nr:baseplate J/gp47 family protein [Escherichia coli]EGJ9612715.1 baseplate J/gp47 family protein [Salmonella enterica subsp. enterica serovar Infantis]HEB1070649.1 baseplate J/gp47 family protein [Escherichia albertii]EEX2758338.1 baseplate J/gp47 family protein [Escherichia coli]EFE1555228.1 baseplate J/gp47 family protein [Escherichia coli]EFH3231619.1 phage tail protein [Escherichia coli]
MPFPVPGVAENTERQLRDIANALPGETIDTGADSDYRIRANAVSGVADGLYMHQGWILRQVFPDTADPEYLELHCRTRNVFRKKATASSGPVVITGTPGKMLPAGAEIRGEGVSVATTADCTIGDEGSAEVTVKSTATGAQANASTTQTATLVSPPEGINSTVTIKSLTGGTDRESDADLLARYLDILRRPPAGGNKYDYKRWALEVDGVTSAYVEPLRRGLGTVDVAITSANDLPSQELINAVLAHIEEVRPVTAKDTMVLAPTKKAVDFVVRVKTSGLTVEQIKPQITDVITDFMNRLEPGQELIISQLETQISLISGVSDRRIIMPSDNVKAVVNESTWEWLRPGSIDIQPFPRES